MADAGGLATGSPAALLTGQTFGYLGPISFNYLGPISSTHSCSSLASVAQLDRAMAF